MPQAARQCPSSYGDADPWPVARQMRVTLMIPDRFMRALYRRYLDEAGYAVTEADGPSGVLDPNGQAPADVIVLDAMEQHAEVVGIVQGLKGNPLTQDIPVLVLVARSNDVDMAGLAAAAVDDCLVKPVRQWELLMRVRGMIRLGRHRQELLNSRSLHGERTRNWEVLLEFTRSVVRAASLDTLLDEILHAATVMTSSRRVSLPCGGPCSVMSLRSCAP